jgi:hypothetical protein
MVAAAMQLAEKQNSRFQDVLPFCTVAPEDCLVAFRCHGPDRFTFLPYGESWKHALRWQVRATLEFCQPDVRVRTSRLLP